MFVEETLSQCTSRECENEKCMSSSQQASIIIIIVISFAVESSRRFSNWQHSKYVYKNAIKYITPFEITKPKQLLKYSNC